MNTQKWIDHFTANTARNARLAVELESPDAPCNLPEAVRAPLARSLAIFQLGESGGGTRLRRYTDSVVSLKELQGYPESVDGFVKEEQSHSVLLARAVVHLRGELLQKQWTNSVFRWMRNLVNLEFNVQTLLTAELIAEVYFGLLARQAGDPVVKIVARKLLKDETAHLAFQRDFLYERLKGLAPVSRMLWRWQFRAIHAATALVVMWDHGSCLRALGVPNGKFLHLALRRWRVFQNRLDDRLARGQNQTVGEKAWESRNANLSS